MKRPVSLSLITLFLLVSCKARTGTNSDSKSVFAVEEACEKPDSKRLDASKNLLPEGTVIGFSPLEQEQIYNALAALPDDYITWLALQHESNKFQIKSVDSGSGGPLGLTFTDIKSHGVTQTQIHPVLTGETRTLVVLHEMGHAIQSRLGSDTFSQLQNEVFTREAGNWFVGTYAKTTAIEYFAESFTSFYCSPKTLTRLANQLPLTYSFLKSVLLPPPWSHVLPEPSKDATSLARPFVNNKYSLGVTFDTSNPAGKGALIKVIVPNGAADRAGLIVGDIIFRISGRNTFTTADAVETLNILSTNNVEISFKRGTPPTIDSKRFLLDVAFRAEDATGKETHDLGASVTYIKNSPSCEDYMTQVVCKELWGAQYKKEWRVGTLCKAISLPQPAPTKGEFP